MFTVFLLYVSRPLRTGPV